MLGIIFTHRRMLAAFVAEDEIKWIKIDGMPHLSHQENYAAIFFKHFPVILDAALWYAYGNGMTPLESLPLALVFPDDNTSSFQTEKQAILDWLETAPYRFSTIFVADTMSLLSKSIPKENVNYLIFEALDKTAFANSNVDEIQRVLSEQDFTKLGKSHGIDYIFSILSKELQKNNFEINEGIKEGIYNNLVNFDVNKKLIINYLGSISNHSIDISLSQTRYYDLLTVERKSYQNILFLLNIFGYSNLSIIFASDFYDNDVFKSFVSHFTQNFVDNNNQILFLSDNYIFENIIHFIYSIILDSSFDKQAKTKHQFLSEIRLKCTDKRKFRTYYQKYVPIAASLGIPSDVFSQYLRQVLLKQKSLSSIGEVITPIKTKTANSTPRTLTFLDFEKSRLQLKNKTIEKNHNADFQAISEMIAHENETSEANSIISYEEEPKIAEDLSFFDDTTMSIVNQFCQFEQSFESNEFLYFKALLNGQSKASVIRLLKNNADEFAVNSFKKLHRRELSYFNNISVIHKLKNGILYYTRDFIEGEPLEQYIKRSGINKKYRLKELSSIDLELILELWRTIYALQFSYKGLNKKSFWVTIHWKLPFRKEVEVNLVDFDSTDSTKENMEFQLIQIFEDLFGKNLTNEFLLQFKNN